MWHLSDLRTRLTPRHPSQTLYKIIVHNLWFHTIVIIYKMIKRKKCAINNIKYVISQLAQTIYKWHATLYNLSACVVILVQAQTIYIWFMILSNLCTYVYVGIHVITSTLRWMSIKLLSAQQRETVCGWPEILYKLYAYVGTHVNDYKHNTRNE